MADLRRNIELKARDPDPARSLAVCLGLGARDHGELWQRVAVPHGRLKLREQRPGTAHLIQYDFLEFEAVATAGSDLTRERALVTGLRAMFAVSDGLLVATGYADQLERGGGRTSS